MSLPKLCYSNEEKEYLGATVILIDAKTGDFGVVYNDEETGREEKLAFKTDPNDVYLVDARNGLLDFSEIEVGDHLDIYVDKDPSGKETVTDITDSSRTSSV